VAVLLYAVLVLLPAAVFGALLWDELRGDHQRTLLEAPKEVRDATSRLGSEVKRRLQTLLTEERARPFVQYADSILVPQGGAPAVEVQSPLRAAPRPAGIQGWFQFDSAEGYEASIQIFRGSQPGASEPSDASLREWLQVEAVEYASTRYFSHDQALEMLLEQEAFWIQGNQRVTEDMGAIAYFTHQGSHGGCALSEVLDFIRPLVGSSHRVLQEFGLHLIPGPDGRPTLFALRYVMIPHFSSADMVTMGLPLCLDALSSNQHWVQGFWLDPTWLDQGMPGEVAETVLADRQHLFSGPPPEGDPSEWVQGEVNLLEGVELVRREAPPQFGRLVVAVNVAEISKRYRTQSFWFAGLSTIMLVSCILGLRLLLVRIRLSSENARRSENFVAAVTHELRTPISVVKLYGEMLRDDWVQDPQKRQDYAGRIVDESNRLALLIDRVLDKRRLEGKLSDLARGDLNQELRDQAEILGILDATDIQWELAPDLPKALFTVEGVHTVLSNLIENARKYAPVDADHPEPIVIRTLLGKRSRIWLEVADRGKGIPARERGKVLEAFYRIGDEATRSKPGTGLGLHLCAQSMRAQRGAIQILDRPGGGTILRAIFRRA